MGWLGQWDSFSERQGCHDKIFNCIDGYINDVPYSYMEFHSCKLAFTAQCKLIKIATIASCHSYSINAKLSVK